MLRRTPARRWRIRMIALPPGVEAEDVPLEKRYRSSTKALMNRIRRLYEEIHRRFGDEGLRLIRDVSTEFGNEILARAREKVKDGDIKAVALYLVRIFNNVNSEGELIEWSDDRVVIRIRKCPYPLSAPGVCEAHTSMERVVVEGLGEGIRYRIEKSIPRGDPYCDHVVERRG